MKVYSSVEVTVEQSAALKDVETVVTKVVTWAGVLVHTTAD